MIGLAEPWRARCRLESIARRTGFRGRLTSGHSLDSRRRWAGWRGNVCIALESKLWTVFERLAMLWRQLDAVCAIAGSPTGIPEAFMNSSEVVQTAQHVQTLLLFRGVERLLVVMGAIACIVLGTLLFRWGVRGTSSVGAEAAGQKIQLTNAAPGTILALFGMVVMLTALISPTRIDLRLVSTPPVAAPSTVGAAAASPSTLEPSVAARGSTSGAGAPGNHLEPGHSVHQAGLSILFGANPQPVRLLLSELQGLETKALDPEQALELLADFRRRAREIDDPRMHPGVRTLVQSVAAAGATDGNGALGLLKQYRAHARQLLELDHPK